MLRTMIIFTQNYNKLWRLEYISWERYILSLEEGIHETSMLGVI